jgi:LytS/YehU family sensor histidine kinase
VSNIVRVNLSIPKPIYKRTLFLILSSISVTAFAVWFTYNRQQSIREREREKESLSNKIIQLEQMALHAQMNPHFIFNCLSSLQNSIYEKNVKEANRLLTRFASLIRQTLDNSSHIYITIEDEVKYLSNYLEVEQIRFDAKFDFTITVDQQIATRHTLIPNMVLQPFIENSIRHGIMHKTEGKGNIEVHFSYTPAHILCSVTDNGVGRAKSEFYKSRLNIQHQSKGTTITFRRIELLNSVSNKNVLIVTKDLMDANNEPSGTNVIIKIPHNYNLKS